MSKKDVFDSTHEENEGAYRKGKEDGRRADRFDRFVDEILDHIPSPGPDRRKSSDKSYHAGWHGGASEERRSGSSSRRSSSSESGGGGGYGTGPGLFELIWEKIPRPIRILIVTILLYPIAGIGGCLVRIPIQGEVPDQGAAIFQNTPALASYSVEALLVPVIFLGISGFSWTLDQLNLKGFLRALLPLVFLIVTGYLGYEFLNSSGIRQNVDREVRRWFATNFTYDRGQENARVFREVPTSTGVIKKLEAREKREPNERIQEFLVPPGRWVETELRIKPNQEVRIHHFDSNEPMKVNIVGTSDGRLIAAGKVLLYYTSSDCSKAMTPNQKLQYVCIQMHGSEPIKLYAWNEVRVGMEIKDR